MKLAKVIGTVVASRKHQSIESTKILMIQPLDDRKESAGSPIAAIDTIDAGVGDLVFWVLSAESTFALDDPNSPVDAAVTGIVDSVDAGFELKDKEKIFSKE